MKRKITEAFHAWKADMGVPRKALLVTGARQIGKSYAIREFGQSEYDCYLEINLFDNTQARKALMQANSVQDFINRMVLFSSEPLIDHKTLVFIDEIQEAPDIVTMAKFLVEDGRYDYAFSGSMLGVEFKNVRSFPVGYVNELTMHPMDFEEFCWAIGVSMGTIGDLREKFRDRAPVDEYVHEAMMRNFRTYLVVGGMPEVVRTFADGKGDLAPIRRLQQELVKQYKHDIGKYAGSRTLHVKDIFDMLPIQLDGEKRRFMLNSVDDNARYGRYKKDFVWLVNAGVALKTDEVAEAKIELRRSCRDSRFKLYESDTGMLISRYVESLARSVYLDDRTPNLGAVYENAIAQELAAAGFDLYYYQTSTRGEVDFVIETQTGEVVPIEVKSGRSCRAHKALDNLLAIEEYDINYGVVFSRLNVEFDVAKKILYLPLYMTMFLSDLNSFETGDELDGFRLDPVAI